MNPTGSLRARLAALVVLFVVAVLAPGTATAVYKVNPEITAPVTDIAGVLSESTKTDLGGKLEAHHERTGVQIAVLVVDTTSGEPIEDYALRVATTWGGGSAKRDSGGLFVLAVQDRRMRLELGYGLEAYIPDALAKRILDRAIPALRAADYDRATTVIVDAVIARTSGEKPAETVSTLQSPYVDSIVEVVVYGVVFLLSALVAHVLQQRAEEARAAKLEESDPAKALALAPLGRSGRWLFGLAGGSAAVAFFLGFGMMHFAAAVLGSSAGRRFLFRDGVAKAILYLVLLFPGTLFLSVVVSAVLDGDLFSYPTIVVAHIVLVLYWERSNAMTPSWLANVLLGSGRSSGSSSSHSSSSSWFSASSSSYRTSSSRSSSSGGSSYRGGGGSFGGGGASSSW